MGKKIHAESNLLQAEPYCSFLNLAKSPHTLRNYHQDLRVLKQFLDTTGINPVTAQPQDLARFAGQLAKPGHTPIGKVREAYSTRSIKRILATTRSFYRYLASIQQISNDPTAVFHNLSIRSPQRNPHPLAAKDREALVRSLQTSDLEGQKISLVVLLGFHCGLRVSEIAHLKVHDVDLDQSQITVIGKGDKERIVPMTEALKQLLKHYLSRNNNGSEALQSLFLFPSPSQSDKPINPNYLELWVKKAALWAKFENPDELTVHVLRHSFGTQLAESGASVYEIRDLMGHSSIMVSENYVKLASTKGRQAHQKAFGAGQYVHALNMGAMFGIESVLKRHRLRIQKTASHDHGQF
jgi:site-specific recombinase XerD